MLIITEENSKNAIQKAKKIGPAFTRCNAGRGGSSETWGVWDIRGSGQEGHPSVYRVSFLVNSVDGHLSAVCQCAGWRSGLVCYHIGQGLLCLALVCSALPERLSFLPRWVRSREIFRTSGSKAQYMSVYALENRGQGGEELPLPRFQAGPKAVPVRPKEDRDGYEPDTQESQFKAARRQEVDRFDSVFAA